MPVSLQEKLLAAWQSLDVDDSASFRMPQRSPF